MINLVIILSDVPFLTLYGLRFLLLEAQPSLPVLTCPSLSLVKQALQPGSAVFTFHPLTDAQANSLGNTPIFYLSPDADERSLRSLLVSLNNNAATEISSATSCLPKSKSSSQTLLSAREVQVLRLLAKGCLNKEIAFQLNISSTTVITHRKHISTKLGIKTVSGLTMYALMNGII